MNLSDTMNHILKTCDIKYQGEIISKELIIQTFGEFLSQTMNKNSHNVGLVMHTGSVCFDVLMVTYAAVSNLISNQMNTEDVIKSLNIGDIVLYGESKKERFIYEGVVDGKTVSINFKGKRLIKLTQNGTTTYISEKTWRFIVPYFGESGRLDGRGIRREKNLRDDFYTDVLLYEKSDIPSVIDTSSVVVVDRDEAERLIKGISISFEGKEIRLLDLVTASYFTEDDEYRYGGNTGRNEAVLKFTSKISVARGLVLSRRGNIHQGIVVIGNDTVRNGMSELPELLNRQSLKYIYLCTSLDFELSKSLLEENEDLELFICSKDFLLEYGLKPSSVSNCYTDELSEQIWLTVNKIYQTPIVSTDMIDGDTYETFRNDLVTVKRLDYNSQEKEDFVIQAYSLMNFFLSAPFPNEALLEIKELGLIETALPEERLNKLKNYLNIFPVTIKEQTERIVDTLQLMNSSFEKQNKKFDWFRVFLYSNDTAKIAVVLPKAYYGVVLKEGGLFSKKYLKNLYFYTAGKFDSKTMFDSIIVFGDYEGKRFNTFRCNSARRIISVLYDFERSKYSYKKRITEKEIQSFQKRSTLQIKSGEHIDLENNIVVKSESGDVGITNEVELEEYISNLVFSNFSTYTRSYQGESESNADIVAIALFGDESKAFFSKYYKGYILDETTGHVKEEDPLNFVEGDTIIFTRNNSETKDIVSSLLAQLVSEKKLPEHSLVSYRKSMLWKKTLIEYVKSNGYSAHEVALQLAETGETVHEGTIRNWMDEDSHIVGPRDIKSIRRIGKVTGEKTLMNDSESIFEACREIRSIRRKILDQIGKAIVEKFSGKPPVQENMFRDIYERIDSLAVTMQIERITHTEMKVPMNMANRPIY